MFPAMHLTPCVGIHSVPPSSSVLLRPGKHTSANIGTSIPTRRFRYRTDAEYEEHFRTVFAKAVQRNLRSDRPVLAELSGGRDSSSIVCMADTIIARGAAETPRLDTISYFDDSEPNWNERPYFNKVEEKRGRTGWHINVGAQDPENIPKPEPVPEPANGRFVPTPGCDGRTSPQIRVCLVSQGNRVLLSGVGGDESWVECQGRRQNSKIFLHEQNSTILLINSKFGRWKRERHGSICFAKPPGASSLPPLWVSRNISDRLPGCSPALSSTIGPLSPGTPPGRIYLVLCQAFRKMLAH